MAADGQQAHKYKNLLNRYFHASKPNSKWVTDISYIHTKQGVLYLSMIRDLYDNSIVAYKTGTEQTVNLVLDTIRLAMKQEKSGPPAKPGACVSPRRASYRQASQEALKNLPLASLAPQPVNGRCLSKINFLDNSKVVDLFSLRSMLEAKAFLLSPAELGVLILLKHTREGRCGVAAPQRPGCSVRLTSIF